MAIALKSTSDQYGTVAVLIHWVSAVLILILILSGFRAAGTIDPAAKAAILRAHVPIASGVLALTILRIIWWWASIENLIQLPEPHVGRSALRGWCMSCSTSSS